MFHGLKKKAPGLAGAFGFKSGRREWDRTTDHHHVKVMLYH